MNRRRQWVLSSRRLSVAVFGKTRKGLSLTDAQGRYRGKCQNLLMLAVCNAERAEKRAVVNRWILGHRPRSAYVLMNCNNVGFACRSCKYKYLVEYWQMGVCLK